MKRYIVMMLTAMVMTSTMQATAVQANDTPAIAVLNLQKLMRDSLAAKSIREQIEEKRTTYQEVISSKEESLRKRDKELSEQRSLLDKEAFEQERKKFAKEVAKVQKDVQEKRTKLDEAYAKSLEQVQEAISKIIKTLGQKRGFAIALPASEVLFYDETMDITADVQKALDKELPKVVVKVGK